MIAEPLAALAVPIDQLRPLEGNPRRGDVAAIRRSLKRFGQRKPVVAREDGTVVAGNHTLAAALELGWSELAVVRVGDDEATAKAYALADNRTSVLGGIDLGDLAAMVAEVQAVDPALLEAASFDEDDLVSLFGGDSSGSASDDQPDPDEVYEAPLEPVTKLGDLWLLGPHRLLCGDSHNAEDVDRLLDGAPVDVVLTDPPFAIYGSSSGVASDVTDDKIVRPFFEATWRVIHRVLKTFGHAYMHCDWRSWSAIWESAKRAQMTPHNMLVWDKGSFGLGSHYANTHELMFFAGKLPKQKTMTSSAPAGQRSVHRPNVLHFDRPSGDERLHNAAKPVAMLEEMIANSSDPGELVLDLFGGSGSTLIAADRQGRVAALMEIEPAGADVICRRFQRLTGTTPILEATGEPHDFAATAAS